MSLKIVYEGCDSRVYCFSHRELKKGSIAIKEFFFSENYERECSVSRVIPNAPVSVFSPLNEKEQKLLSNSTEQNISEKLLLKSPYIPKDLFDRIEAGIIPLEEIRRIVRQIAASIAWLHAHNIAHRDIKIENIGIKGSRIYVRDYDHAGILKEKDQKMNGVTGTLKSMAPEIFWEYTVKCDWWSFATVVWELYTGELFLNGIVDGINVSNLKEFKQATERLCSQFYDMFFSKCPSSDARFFSWQDELRSIGYLKRKDPPEVVKEIISFLSQFLVLEPDRKGWEGVVSHDFTKESIPRHLSLKNVGPIQTTIGKVMKAVKEKTLQLIPVIIRKRDLSENKSENIGNQSIGNQRTVFFPI